MESDGATARAVCRPSVSSHTDALHTCWRAQSTRPIFDHRETVMGAVPAGAHSLRESRGAMAVRRRQCLLIACRCLTTTMWPTRNQQTPYQCAHRMQISSTYRHESRRSVFRRSAFASRARARSHATHSPPTVRVRLMLCATNLDRRHRRSSDEEKLGEVANIRHNQ